MASVDMSYNAILSQSNPGVKEKDLSVRFCVVLMISAANVIHSGAQGNQGCREVLSYRVNFCLTWAVSL